jgi:hypothetical protein
MLKDIRIKLSEESVVLINESKERDFLENFYYDEVPGKLFEVDNATIWSNDSNHLTIAIVLTGDYTISYQRGVNTRDERFARIEIGDPDGEVIFANKASSNEELGLSEFDTLSESVLAFGLTYILE